MSMLRHLRGPDEEGRWRLTVEAWYRGELYDVVAEWWFSSYETAWLGMKAVRERWHEFK